MATAWTEIDWVATGAWMQAWAAFLGAFAVIYAAKTGAATFQGWLKQKQTERRIAVAERALDVAYRLRRAFKAIRSPGYSESEASPAQASLAEKYNGFAGLGDEQRGRLIWGQVVLNRLASYRPDWEELHHCTPLLKAHFGDEPEAALEALWGQQAVVRTAALMYGNWEFPQQDMRDRFEADLWDEIGDVEGGVGDRVSASVNAAIATLDRRLLPILRSEVG